MSQRLVYLNDANTVVSVGDRTDPVSRPASDPFNNVSTEQSLANTIDLDSADSADFHNQISHVWVTGTLELIFDFDEEYEIQQFHFWNYFTESYDVDRIELTFFDADGLTIESLTLEPETGGPANSDSEPIYAEDFSIATNSNAKSVSAVFTASNDQLDFNNLGFTASESGASPAARVFLTDNSTFTLSEAAEVFGRSGGSEKIRITEDASDVTVDGNVEQIEFPTVFSSTTFQVVDGQLEISAGGTPLTTFTGGLNQDVTLQFANGEGTLSQTGATSFTLTGPGGQAPIGTTPTTPDIGLGGPVAVGASDDGRTFDADTGNATFDFADGTYGVTVENFSGGDVLDFADVGDSTGASFNVLGDSDQADGEQVIEAVDPGDGSTITVTLVGLSGAQDSNIFNQSSFESEFGSGSILL
jgi:hypothetical protein